MPRMRHLIVPSVLALLAVSAAGRPADASLILNPPAPSFPDIASGVLTDKLSYTYDPSTQTGQFQMTNRPASITAATASYDIGADASGIRSEVLGLTLDKAGNLLSSGNNSFSLTGSIDAGGQHFSGVLLTGTPTQFGWAPPDPINNAGSATFDLNMKITGGLLQNFYGPDAYMRIDTVMQSTFQGRFDQSFFATKPLTNTRAYHSPQPFPIPEPTTLVVVLIGGAGVTYRHRRRLLTA